MSVKVTRQSYVNVEAVSDSHTVLVEFYDGVPVSVTSVKDGLLDDPKEFIDIVMQISKAMAAEGLAKSGEKKFSLFKKS